MISVRTNFVRTALAGALFLFAVAAQAQCRSFAKNKCVPELAPYKFNESFNAAQLAPGEEAEVNLTFFSGQEYRVMVCTHPILGEVNWKLMDASNKILFESMADAPKRFFDLRMANTQQLKVHVWVPSKPKTDMVHVGCVAIMVGFKE
ncbi:MAG: hypothetical protein IPG10_00925 [Flavobacteriales bacterium]|jgi:hypothetical protein|nr:hypothetical protein [Flavobacteriales bacterium]MBK6753243.1 hypothetical protein [Flavobacteriales bacterium]MBK7085025.1 hypothetical protein [Flavobacteriales bacterium]MBK7269730.1 hypothetical protein [Flavobacteriales bacterium]MBK7752569.1 hypothetical protein [Flavobacteriales bacterium]